MARYLGVLKGTVVQKQKEDQPERVVCEGDSTTGLLAQIASWNGAIQVKAYKDKRTGQDMVRISKIKWYGKGIEREIYHGPMGVD